MVTLPRRDVVVVAASAGGLDPLRTLLRGLPPDLPAALLVVMHVPATGGRTLPRILDRSGPLRAATAINGERLQHGRVYVAAADHHLVLAQDDEIRLSRGPRQNGVRPAADPLFRSAAPYAGPRVTAVVLSGTMDDAALGAATVERLGGKVMVQDPEDASYASMPRSALATTRRSLVLPAEKLATAIVEAVTEDVAPAEALPDDDLLAEIEGLLAGGPETDPATHAYSELSCPECGGPLYYAGEPTASSLDCRVGHRWSPQSLLEEQSAAVERALWLAVRLLDERGRLTSRLAAEARERGHALTARQFHAAAEEAARSADTIRGVASSISAESPQDPVGAGGDEP